MNQTTYWVELVGETQLPFFNNYVLYRTLHEMYPRVFNERIFLSPIRGHVQEARASTIIHFTKQTSFSVRNADCPHLVGEVLKLKFPLFTTKLRITAQSTYDISRIKHKRIITYYTLAEGRTAEEFAKYYIDFMLDSGIQVRRIALKASINALSIANPQIYRGIGYVLSKPTYVPTYKGKEPAYGLSVELQDQNDAPWFYKTRFGPHQHLGYGVFTPIRYRKKPEEVRHAKSQAT